MTNSLVVMGSAVQMLAEVRTIDDAINLIDLAEAARIYAKQIDLGLEAQNHAAEIKLRAQRRAGEILDAMDKNTGAMGTGSNQYEVRLQGATAPPTYAELGIDKRDAHVWQKIAAMPEEIFERTIHESKEITTAATYREAIKAIAADNPPPQPLPQNKFNLIYADPPWRYDFSVSESRDIENQYPTMDISEICNIPVQDIASDDCVLFLWATSPKLREALQVIEAWGFEYKTNMVWIKDKIGMGYYARQQHELLLIATRGKPNVPLPEDRPSSIISGNRTEHSKKPESVYLTINRMYPGGKKIELFARSKYPDWEVWGNEC